MPVYQGTELFEIYSCGFDLWTEHLLLKFLSQNLALKTLCFGNNIWLMFGKAVLRNFTLNDVGQLLHCLILEDWPINSSNCSILRDLLRKMASTLTSLSLKGCLIDRNQNVLSEIVSGIADCTSLQTLDLSGNSLGNYGTCFSGTFIKLTQLNELSLRGNRLPTNVVVSIMKELLESSKQRGSRMKVLDVRGNKIIEEGHSVRKTIRNLQRSFVDRIICDQDDK
ncbi:hypothetical protein ElyMa_003453400 [Elysia marginata]|uniref:Uncharacterized protein n=1 Tax=Elysia marginata TaxID=1093978 RepID=A0AAV4E9K8_9GAST|nr:hypothetical protein ElyMa_003453400 [Elysia marginata]